METHKYHLLLFLEHVPPLHNTEAMWAYRRVIIPSGRTYKVTMRKTWYTVWLLCPHPGLQDVSSVVIVSGTEWNSSTARISGIAIQPDSNQIKTIATLCSTIVCDCRTVRHTWYHRSTAIAHIVRTDTDTARVWNIMALTNVILTSINLVPRRTFL